MKEEKLKALLTLLDEIQLTSIDSSESSGIASAMSRITTSSDADLENVLKTVRDELFHHKGPLYDSSDTGEMMQVLREQCRSAFKDLINTLIKIRKLNIFS